MQEHDGGRDIDETHRKTVQLRDASNSSLDYFDAQVIRLHERRAVAVQRQAQKDPARRESENCCFRRALLAGSKGEDWRGGATTTTFKEAGARMCGLARRRAAVVGDEAARTPRRGGR